MDYIHFEKKIKAKIPNPLKTQLVERKGLQNTIKTMGLCYKGRFLLKNDLVKKKIIASDLPLLLYHSISSYFSLHTNYFIAWGIEIPVPEYMLFQLTKGDHQEIFCCAPLWKAAS